jgi:hypothetical protein
LAKKEIPCHKFVLGVTSPVFYSSLFEKKDDDPFRKHRRTTMRMSTSVADMLGLAKDAMSSPSALCKAERIELEGIDPDVFFEFMRFVYTDKCKITLDM